jgi:hypothetical protein
MASDTLDDVAQASRDLSLITIGLGVLAFQKAQVQRRAIERALAAQCAQRSGSSLADPLDLIRRSLQQLRDCR